MEYMYMIMALNATFIGSIFYRSKPRGITSDEYNSKVDQSLRISYLHHIETLGKGYGV
jgi:hypothetical protein